MKKTEYNTRSLEEALRVKGRFDSRYGLFCGRNGYSMESLLLVMDDGTFTVSYTFKRKLCEAGK